MAPTSEEIEAALTALARDESGRVLSILARRLGDLDLADEAVQDAMAEALRTWPRVGVPDRPAAWLMTVAKRKAIDRVRRTKSAQRRTEAAAPELTTVDEPADAGGLSMIEDDGEIEDERLRLVLLCCHPALDREAQIALTLRLVGGLTTAEIAAAFLVPEATLAQRIVRAKRKIRTANIPLSIPEALDERLSAVLGVLYLVFNEGYFSNSGQDALIRQDLTTESIRLTRVVQQLLPEHPEVSGLLALQLFLTSRDATRTDVSGEIVLLDDQDRSAWDLELIAEGNRCVGRAMRLMKPGPYQVQAAIAAHHANARTATDTDWPMIVSLYQQLEAMDPSPVVALNHAVALAMADGPAAGLARFDELDGLDDYHLFHASRGELLARSHQPEEARQAYRRALELAESPTERRHVERRLAELEPHG